MMRMTVLGVLVGAAIAVAGLGCKRAPGAHDGDPQGRFQVLPFEPIHDGVDAAGTTFRHARIDVVVPGGGIEHVAWQEEEYADGADNNWKWTLVDEKTGVRRVYTSSSGWRRASVSDGHERHTASMRRVGRTRRMRVDKTDYATPAAACSALAQTSLCSSTPASFRYVRAGLLRDRPLPRASAVNIEDQFQPQSFVEYCIQESC